MASLNPADLIVYMHRDAKSYLRSCDVYVLVSTASKYKDEKHYVCLYVCNTGVIQSAVAHTANITWRYK